MLEYLTRWVRLRLRAALWRQWKTPRRRRAALLALGVRSRLASNTAGSGLGPWYLARAKGPDKAVPDAKAQRNFTDSESRIMPDGAHKGSFVQAYNAQIAVHSEAQIIVAAEITQDCNDKQQLAAMLEQVQKNTGAKPVAPSADTGYWSPEQIADKRVEGIDLHVATTRTNMAPRRSPSARQLNRLKTPVLWSR